MSNNEANPGNNNSSAPEQIPHSGVYGYEKPVREFDNTSLSEAKEQGFLEIPETPEALHPKETKKPSKLKRNIALGIAGLGIGSLVPAYFATQLGAEGPADPDTRPSASGPVTPGTEVTPDSGSVDPSAKLEPMQEKVSPSIMPLLVNGNYLELPQAGTPEQEVQQYCNVIAGAISSDRPELLRQAYGDTAGEALDNDELLYSEYKKQVEKIQSQYPATKPLLALECSNVNLDPQEFANGSHKVSFSVSGSLIDEDGRLYAKSLWDKSNIAEDRILTLNRDGFTIKDDGTEINGIKAEFSELVD